jgi:hypothetical protein
MAAIRAALAESENSGPPSAFDVEEFIGARKGPPEATLLRPASSHTTQEGPRESFAKLLKAGGDSTHLARDQQLVSATSDSIRGLLV